MLSVPKPLVPETLKLMMRVSTVSKAVTPLLSSGEAPGLATEIVSGRSCREVVGAVEEARLLVLDTVVR